MTDDRELLKTLESAYWAEIVAYFEAMPEALRPASYKKYAGIREVIALSQAGSKPQPSRQLPLPLVSTLPKPRSLTENEEKEAIHAGVATYYVRRNNKSSLIRDALADLAQQGVHVPGKSPASTLAALISRDSTGKYAKEREGYWMLSADYYEQQTKLLGVFA